MTKKCGNCGAKDSDIQPLSTCTGCNKALYCSEQCQRSAWKLHKKRCRRASIQTDTLTLDLERLADFNAALNYSAKYMRLKHVDLMINRKDNEEEIKLTAETLQSFLRPAAKKRPSNLFLQTKGPQRDSAGTALEDVNHLQ